jgi:hypothetical protein
MIYVMRQTQMKYYWLLKIQKYLYIELIAEVESVRKMKLELWLLFRMKDK